MVTTSPFACKWVVFVATPDNEILQIVNKSGGKAILTERDHNSGSDRIYEIYSKKLKDSFDLIINLQGDMPNIQSNEIIKLNKLRKSGVLTEEEFEKAKKKVLDQ